ncbi:hypothetical protein LEMES_01608 [Leuconostoc mesenteroides]|nr:hypothetical protein LEMES_01608 [Leuconostoc mesenteroides]GEL84069.1 hypothetical protein LME03_04170 [Leuconostoc mesenteroides subsp. mesenteroides]
MFAILLVKIIFNNIHFTISQAKRLEIRRVEIVIRSNLICKYLLVLKLLIQNILNKNR